MNAMNKKRGLAGMVAVLFLSLAVCLLSACSDEMEVQQSYPFKVENMPVPTRIVKGETVEIRCELKREGHFSDARYTIRYFQPDGKGTLRMDDGMVLYRLRICALHSGCCGVLCGRHGHRRRDSGAVECGAYSAGYRRCDRGGCRSCSTTCRVLCGETIVKTWEYPRNAKGVEFRQG